MLLLNSLSSILLLSLISRGLIVGGRYIEVELPVKANAAYNLGISQAVRPLELDFSLII